MKCPGCGRRLFFNRSRCVCGYHLNSFDEVQRKRKQAVNALRWGVFELIFGATSILLSANRFGSESLAYVSAMIMALGLFNIGFYIVAMLVKNKGG